MFTPVSPISPEQRGSEPRKYHDSLFKEVNKTASESWGASKDRQQAKSNRNRYPVAPKSGSPES
jgi:hypothetical protein